MERARARGGDATDRRPTVGIVGAGITGLALHHYLREAGVESVVFEASDDPGGVVRTRRQGGRVLECGPQRTRLTPAVADLVAAAGIRDRAVEAADALLYVYHAGALREVPRSLRTALTTDLLSWRGKCRVLFEPFTGPPRAGETVAGYLTRAFGREFAERLGGPLYAGLYASDPAEMPVEHSLSRALDRFGVEGSLLAAFLRASLRGRTPPPVVSFEDGLEELPRALAERYAADVALETPVREVRATPEGYDLLAEDGTTGVETVVLTTPASVAASLLDGLGGATVDPLRTLTYNPMAVVHLDADAPLSGAGHQVPFDEPQTTLGVTWNDCLFERPDREGVYTCYLGGAKTPAAVEWSDDRLGTVAAEEFEAATGGSATPVHVHRLTPGMPAYDRSWDGLDRVTLPPGVHLCANYESRAGIPGRVRRARRLAAALAGDE